MALTEFAEFRPSGSRLPLARAYRARPRLAQRFQRQLDRAAGGRRRLHHPRVQRGLIYLSQILLARWMGSFEFGIYVYVWTWVLLIGDLADLGLASAAQRFIPEYTSRGRSICCAAS